MNVTSLLSATSDSDLLVALRPDDFIKELLDGDYDSAQHDG